jgi:portal protein
VRGFDQVDSQAVQRDPSGTDKDAELLRDIREDYCYFRDFWQDNHREMKTDLRFVAGDPWEPDEREAREDNNRPVLCCDELGQYQNATINNLRQNKRAIKVQPKGNGATDKDAERRSAIIRGIEYKSNAQGAYTNAFENQINCGMGFFRVTTKVISKEGEVEPRIKGIENPLSVLLDPNAKEPDFSDMKRCFVMDIVRLRDFQRQYPKATKRSFAADDMTTAPDWFAAENILVAEYWRNDGYDENGENGKITQYVTNGVEILSRTPWPGSWIPIIAAMGKKVYVPFGSEMKRYYYSQIRLARGPQMMLAYGASQEAEVVGMMPRVPVIGYVGQFETDKDGWDNLNKVPRNYIQADPTVDAVTGQVLPLPTRMATGPDIAAYEAFMERWRRQIQAAMGQTPLPTAAQRQNEKSGVALEKIQTQQSIGSFHFTDNFDRAIENCGRQLDELITKVMDTPRQVTSRHADETHAMLHIVPRGTQVPMPEPGQPPVDPEDVLDPAKGDFDVTISTGMSYQSQREEASAFVDTLIGELGNLPLAPQQKASLLARAISLKDIGPIGDDLAKIIDPSADQQPVPPQAQQAIGQMQQQLQVLHAANTQLQTQVHVLEFEKKAQVVKHQGDMELERLKLDSQITVAEITTKAQILSERIEFVHDMVKQLHDQAHASALSAQEAQQGQDAQAQGAQQQQDLAAQQGDQQMQQQEAQNANDANDQDQSDEAPAGQ